MRTDPASGARRTATLRRVLHPRPRRRIRGRDRGSALMEAIIACGMLGMMTLGLATSTSASLQVERTAVGHSVAAEAAHAATETARATTWTQVATDTNPVDPSVLNGLAPVTGGTLKATQQETVRGIALTVDTAVGWQQAPAYQGGYGAKLVVVTVQWSDTPGKTRSITQQTTIRPGPGEAAPPGVRSAG